MAAEFQKWVKIASDMGYEGTELREFVRVKQEECKAEKLRQDELTREEKKLELAREERKLELEKEQRLAEREREEKRRVEDIAREEKKQALEREDRLRADEREANLKKLELENLKEIKLKELEVRAAHDKQQSERGDFVQNGLGREHAGTSDHTKNVTFREDRDCLDAFLLRFERACTVYEVPERFWAMTLARSLEGKALEVYQRLDVEQAHDYEKLKQELLRRFKLTEGGYRKLFKRSEEHTSELQSQSNLVCRL